VDPCSLLLTLQARGCTLRSDGDDLRVKAPPGALTDELRAAIKEHKKGLLAIVPPIGDPRPDLEEDSALWDEVLAVAEAIDEEPISSRRSVYALLHGLRCCGARLNWTSRGNLKLDYSAVAEMWRDERDLRENWLMPLKDGIKAVFVEAERRFGNRKE